MKIMLVRIRWSQKSVQNENIRGHCHSERSILEVREHAIQEGCVLCTKGDKWPCLKLSYVIVGYLSGNST